MAGLMYGDESPEVRKLQEDLKLLEYYQAGIDGDFGPKTLFAVKRFQGEQKLKVDGVADLDTLLKLAELVKAVSSSELIDVEICSRMFPHTPKRNIEEYLPYIMKALKEVDLYEKEFILIALATIRAESESFMPVNEHKSKENTSSNGHPFDLYDKRTDLGNHDYPDGQKYRGRGFIQLRGKENYRRYSDKLGLGDILLEEPDMANNPVIASQLLAYFLKEKEQGIRDALKKKNLLQARRLIYGDSKGFEQFSEAYFIGSELMG
jgi:peptidoglycan L-alanyl-D-glutamate endopeptidase CwlK